MKYYSIYRPIAPGTCPKKDGRETIVNFDAPQYCDGIGREAWGYIDYPDPLGKEEADSYELVPEGMKTYWCVTTSANDRGKVIAHITSSILSDVKPESTFVQTRRRDIYTDWFENKAEAERFAKEAGEA